MDIYDLNNIEKMVNGFGLPNMEKIKTGSNLLKIDLDIKKIIDFSYLEVSKVISDTFILDRCFMEEFYIKDFIEFYLLGVLWIKKDFKENKPVSLEEYYKNISDDIYRLNILTKRTLERRWKELNKNNIIYNNNHKFSKNNINNRVGHKIYNYEINELEFLLINYDNPIIKKIRTNKVDKLKFEELGEYVQLARDNITNSSDKNKNIGFYKLERRTHFELLKFIIKCIEEKNENYEDENILSLVCFASKIPDIKNIKKYVRKFFELEDDSDRKRLLLELDYLGRCVYHLISGYCIYILEGYSLNDQIKYIYQNEAKYLNMYNLIDYKVELVLSNEELQIGDSLLKRIGSENCRGTKNKS